MKKLAWFLLLLVPSFSFAQGTGTAGSAFEIGRPLSTRAIRDSLVARDVFWIDSTEAKGIAQGIASDTGASVLAIANSNARDWAGDSAQAALTAAKTAAGDSARVAAGDSASASRLYTQNTIEDSLVEVRAELRDNAGDSARAVAPPIVGDSLGEIRTGIDSLNPNVFLVSPGAMTDSTCRGLMVRDTVGETVAFGDILYRKGTGWFKADADTNTTLPALAMSTGVINAGAVGKLLLMGYAKATGWNWSMADGSRYLRADQTTAGQMVSTAVASGVWQQYVAIPISPDVVYFKPDILPVLMK